MLGLGIYFVRVLVGTDTLRLIYSAAYLRQLGFSVNSMLCLMMRLIGNLGKYSMCRILILFLNKRESTRFRLFSFNGVFMTPLMYYTIILLSVKEPTLAYCSAVIMPAIRNSFYVPVKPQHLAPSNT